MKHGYGVGVLPTGTVVRSPWLLGLEIGLVVLGAAEAQCSSSDNAPATGADSSTDVTADTSGGGTIDGDAGSAQMCEASSTMPVGADATTQSACTSCVRAKCAMQLAACAVDCSCGPINVCILNVETTCSSSNMAYSSCPGAIGAISSNNSALTNVVGCTAQSCPNDCFPSVPTCLDAGASADARGQ
jgi:hypothetical protein